MSGVTRSRVLLGLSVALLVLFSASAARHFLPGLKAQTRAAMRVISKDRQLASSRRSTPVKRDATSFPDRHARVRVPRTPGPTWRPPVDFSPLVSAAPDQALRWSSVGGHGRLGPGSRI